MFCVFRISETSKEGGQRGTRVEIYGRDLGASLLPAGNPVPGPLLSADSPLFPVKIYLWQFCVTYISCFFFLNVVVKCYMLFWKNESNKIINYCIVYISMGTFCRFI